MFSRKDSAPARIEWVYGWKFGAKDYPITEKINQIVGQEIANKIWGQYVSNQGVLLNKDQATREIEIELSDPSSGKKLFFRAIFQSLVAPTNMIKVDQTTDVVASFDDGSKQREREINEKQSADIKKFVTQEVIYNPLKPDAQLLESLDVFNSLVGIDKENIQNELTGFLSEQSIAERWSKHITGSGAILPIIRRTNNRAPVILFAGEPGTGKSALSQCIGAKIALELQEPVTAWFMGINLLGTGIQGRASTMVTEFFRYAQAVSYEKKIPLLIIFDEAEAFVGRRVQSGESSGAHQVNAIVDAILRGVDDIPKGGHRIATIFITNFTLSIDDALTRRCSHFWFPRPNDEVRKQIFASTLEGCNFTDQDILTFVDATKPKTYEDKFYAYTGSDIVLLILRQALQKAIKANSPITKEMILNACESTLPTGFPRMSRDIQQD